jgi:hypothetical protein
VDHWAVGAEHAVLLDHRWALAASATAPVWAELQLEHGLVDSVCRAVARVWANSMDPRLKWARYPYFHPRVRS